MPSPETILLAVTGRSPAVLTETLWALAYESEPIIPHRVIAVTTFAGRDRIVADLFTSAEGFGGQCVWDALRAALASAGHDLTGRLRFGTTADDLRVITSSHPRNGRSMELSDLRDRAENEAAADFLLDQVRGITANPDTHLIASIAGGRKTMGALLYACMTLAGRDEDRITHVLVSEPYETLPGFFFPAQPGPLLQARNNKDYHAASDARIELAEVPFVPIRNLFQRELGRAVGTFSHLVATCRTEIRQRATEDIRLEIHTTRPALRLNLLDLKLTEREHHLMLCLAVRAKGNQLPVTSYKDALDAISTHAQQWRDLIETGKLPAKTLPAAVIDTEHDLVRVLSDLRRKLKTLGSSGHILAAALPQKARFSLDVPGPLIHIQ